MSVILLHHPGEEISLDTKNELLALVAYRGLGSMWATHEDAAGVMKAYKDFSWWPEGRHKVQDAGEGKAKHSEESADVTFSEVGHRALLMLVLKCYKVFQSEFAD